MKKSILLILLLCFLSGCGQYVIDSNIKATTSLQLEESKRFLLEVEKGTKEKSAGVELLEQQLPVIKKAYDNLNDGWAVIFVDKRIKLALYAYYIDGKIAVFDIKRAKIKPPKYAYVVISRGLPLLENVVDYFYGRDPSVNR